MEDLRLYQLIGTRVSGIMVFAVTDAQNVALLDDEGMGIMCSKEAIEKGLVPPDPRVMIRDYKIRIEGSPKEKADILYTPGTIVDLVVDPQAVQEGFHHRGGLHSRYTVRSPGCYEVLEALNLSDAQVSAWKSKYTQARRVLTNVEESTSAEIKRLTEQQKEAREIFHKGITLQQLLN